MVLGQLSRNFVILAPLCWLFFSAQASWAQPANLPIPALPPAVPLDFPQKSYDDALAAQQWSAWGTVIAALTNAAALVVLTLTLLTTRRLLNEAKATTKAAWASVDAAREIGQSQIRAYLSFVDAQILLPEKEGFPSSDLTVKNSGNSPATSVVILCRLIVDHSTNDGQRRSSTYWIGAKIADLQSGETLRVSNLRVPRQLRTVYSKLETSRVEYIMATYYVLATDVFGNEIWARTRAMSIPNGIEIDGSKRGSPEGQLLEAELGDFGNAAEQFKQ